VALMLPRSRYNPFVLFFEGKVAVVASTVSMLAVLAMANNPVVRIKFLRFVFIPGILWFK